MTAELNVHDAGKDAEGYHIHKGVDLDAEAFFILGAVLFATGDLAVKHVTQTAEQQAKGGEYGVSACYHADAGNSGCQTQIGQNDCIIVKSDHILSPLDFSFLYCYIILYYVGFVKSKTQKKVKIL